MGEGTDVHVLPDYLTLNGYVTVMVEGVSVRFEFAEAERIGRTKGDWRG